jgi:hypothetical protein
MTAKSGEEARDNGDKVTTYDVGMCQKFVRGPCWEVGSLYGSAIEAWNGAREKHPGDRTPPTGAPVYYSGGQYGHAVIAQKAGSGKIRTTDAPSSGKVSDQDLAWPERAWGYKYLGWTGDINGVNLPLGSDTGTEDDEVELDDKISNCSPDQGSEGELTVGQTLNQARGYAEDSYDRVKALQDKVAKLDDKVDKILNAVT